MGSAMTDLTRLHRLTDLSEASDWLRGERDQEIRILHRNGMPVAQIVTETGLTKQRIHQIIHKETR